MRSGFRLSSPELRYLAWAFDLVLILVISQLVYAAYFGVAVNWFSWESIYKNLVIGVCFGLVLFGDSLYRSWRVTELRFLLRTITTVCASIFVGLAIGLFLTKSAIDVSRGWFILWGLSCWLALLLQRLIVYLILRFLRSRGYNYRTVVLIGRGSISNEVKNIVEQSKWGGIKIIDSIDTVDLYSRIMAYGVNQPNEAWLCIPMSNEEEIRSALNALRHSTLDIRLVPDVFTLKLINHGVSNVMGMPMLDLSISPISSLMRLAKAVEDKLLALFILILIAPVMFLISVGICLTSPGPIIFVQRRWGWNGREINVYKFRTMFEHHEPNGGVTQATINDPRITPFGAFLRRTSLDELPQFINVLQGRMSIVGPRPHAVAHNEYYKELVPRYMLRHKVKPGITGWAQINGYRGEIDTLHKMQKRVELDIYYIENFSIYFDLEIIFKTISKLFFDEKAF